MSGHSKWATTKRAKAAVDSKRGKVFTKIANEITVAARSGGDPAANPRLRVAVEKARGVSMPKDNIDRAIKRGTGELGGAALEEINYEAFGPDGVALLIHCFTDNRNRTVATVKHLLEHHGGRLGEMGATARLFQRRAVLELSSTDYDDSKELAIIDAGAEDIQHGEEQIIVTAPPEALELIRQAAQAAGLQVIEAEVKMVAPALVTPSKPEAVISLFEALDECDEIDDFASNADV